MNWQYSKKSVRQLAVAAVLVVVAGCGVGGNDKVRPGPDSVVNQNLIIGAVEIIGTNCRAEVITEPNGATHFKSSYLNIYSDGSEQVQNVVETETPCP